MGSPRREFEVQLPIGYTAQSGTVHRRAVIRKMTGHEEALLYDTSLSPCQMVTELIRSCLTRLGDLEAMDSGTVAELYTADRNFLLIELRRITLGDRLLASYICPGCGNDMSVMEDLSQFDVRRLEDGAQLRDIEIDLEDGYVDREGTLHQRLVLTLPRGTDEVFVAPMMDRDPLKAQDALVLRCIKQFGTLPRATLEAYGVKILRDLTLGDRLVIETAIASGSPGVDLNRQVDCPHCGRAFTSALDMSRFFFPSPAEGNHFAGRSFTLPITSTGHGNRSLTWT
jgi:hypothetical protein